MNEKWKPIKGFEESYQVSNKGRVKSLERKVWNGSGYSTIKERILKAGKATNGYLFVALCKNSKRYYYRVHRLVATAFIDNPDNKPQVNHIDENKENNNVENLEWCTAKENMNHGNIFERRKDSISKKIYAIDKDNNVHYFKNQSEVEKYGYSKHCVNKCLKGKNKTHKDMRWFYAS